MGQKQYGIDTNRIQQYAEEIKRVKETGIELAIVIGGGNIFRGVQAENSGMDRVQGDYMGMLATVINGMALQSALEQTGLYTRLMSGIKMEQVCEPFHSAPGTTPPREGPYCDLRSGHWQPLLHH